MENCCQHLEKVQLKSCLLLVIKYKRYSYKTSGTFLRLFSVLAAQDRNPREAKFMSSCTECWLTVDGNIVVYGTICVKNVFMVKHTN